MCRVDVRAKMERFPTKSQIFLCSLLRKNQNRLTRDKIQMEDLRDR